MNGCQMPGMEVWGREGGRERGCNLSIYGGGPSNSSGGYRGGSMIVDGNDGRLLGINIGVDSILRPLTRLILPQGRMREEKKEEEEEGEGGAVVQRGQSYRAGGR